MYCPHASLENLDLLCRVATRIAGAALRTDSPSKLGAEIHALLKPLIPAPNAFIAVREDEEGYISFPYWADGKDPAPALKAPGNGITEYVLRTGAPLFLDPEKHDQMVRDGQFAVLGSKSREFCAVPLKRFNEEVFGVFAVQTYDGDPPLEPRHGAVLQELSPAIAAAVLAHSANRAGRRRDALLNAAADIAHIFLTGSDWIHQTRDALARIGPAAEASRAYLFSVERSPDGRYLATQRAEWVNEGISPQIDNPDLINLDLAAGGYARWVEFLRRGDPISGPVSEFPATERPLLEAQDIKSLHVVPIHAEGHWWGFMGLDDCASARAWLRSERDALRLCAKIIGQAIERERAQQQLQLQHTALSAAANSIMITDAQGRILWVNDAFIRSSGYQRAEILFKTPAILSSGKHGISFFKRMWETILRGEVWRGEIVNRRKDGALYTEDMTITPVLGADGAPTHFIAIKQDITERKNLEQQLHLAQRLESIGRLAGGIAHDFNNILQAITGFSSILLSEMSESDPRRNDVLEIDRAAGRAADLTRQLLMFSRRQKMEVSRVWLNDIVRGAEKMLRRLLPENISIDIRLAENLPAVRGDAGQLEQTLVNLALNARDAMPNGGRLTVETFSEILGPDQLPPVDGVQPGVYVALDVSDTGSGMSQDVIDKLFEPFFTTKEPTRGTGLGLPVVYGIVRQHSGFISVQSAPGAGSQFRIRLPADKDDENVELPPEKPPEGILLGNGEHILVVEDEDGVRELIVRVLSNSNYRVTAVREAGEAKRLLSAPQAPYAVLFSDVVLPDGNGLDLAEQARREHPRLKVLLTSGYMQERERWSGRISQLDGFLSKPYPPTALLRLLRRALEAPSR
jgi:PAS domain S-box-containing protein